MNECVFDKLCKESDRESPFFSGDIKRFVQMMKQIIKINDPKFIKKIKDFSCADYVDFCTTRMIDYSQKEKDWNTDRERQLSEITDCSRVEILKFLKNRFPWSMFSNDKKIDNMTEDKLYNIASERINIMYLMFLFFGPTLTLKNGISLTLSAGLFQ